MTISSNGISKPAGLPIPRGAGGAAEGRAADEYPAARAAFSPPMDLDGFYAYIRGRCVYADPILPQAHTYLTDPTIRESELFQEGRDVFTFINVIIALSQQASRYSTGKRDYGSDRIAVPEEGGGENESAKRNELQGVSAAVPDRGGL